jgi:hypothetical protein
MDKVTMGQAFLQLRQSSPVCTFLPTLHTRTPFTYHWCCMTLATCGIWRFRTSVMWHSASGYVVLHVLKALQSSGLSHTTQSLTLSHPTRLICLATLQWETQILPLYCLLLPAAVPPHVSASSSMGHVNMTSYPIEVTNNTCQTQWEYSIHNKTNEG